MVGIDPAMTHGAVLVVLDGKHGVSGARVTFRTLSRRGLGAMGLGHCYEQQRRDGKHQPC